jgi:hypothetical protein
MTCFGGQTGRRRDAAGRTGLTAEQKRLHLGVSL